MKSSQVVLVDSLAREFREGLSRRRIAALAGVSFCISEGRTCGLIGPNGAGKTTLLNLLMDFIKPTRGGTWIGGIPSSSPESRRCAGFLPEDLTVDPFCSAERTLCWSDALTGEPVDGRQERVRSALEKVGLWDVRHRPARAYSKGMKRRLGLALAILGDPQLLILDEPMAGMDPASRQSVLDMIAGRRKRGLTTLLSSHILAEMETVIDQVVILHRGKVMADALLSELLPDGGSGQIVFLHRRPECLDDWLQESGLVRRKAHGLVDGWSVETTHDDSKKELLARLGQVRARVVSDGQHRTLQDVFLRITETGGTTS